MESESGAGGADSSEATRPPAEGGNVAREAVDAIEVHEHENDAEDDASDCVVGGGVALAAGSDAIRRSQARATCGAESLVAVPSKGSVFDGPPPATAGVAAAGVTAEDADRSARAVARFAARSVARCALE